MLRTTMQGLTRNSRTVTALVGLSIAVSTHAFQPSGYVMPATPAPALWHARARFPRVVRGEQARRNGSLTRAGCCSRCLLPSSRLLHWRPSNAVSATGVRAPRTFRARPLFSLRPVGPPRTLKMSSSTKIDWPKELLSDHPENNVSPYIANLVGRDLHLKKDHPLGIIKDKIETYFKGRDASFECKDSLNPIVTKKQCFDDLLIPPEHPGIKFSKVPR